MDRIVKVVIKGEVGDVLGKLTAVTSATKATVASMTDGSKESAAFRQNLTALGNTAGKFGLVAAGGVALAVRAFANFDEAMSAVAATGDDARGSIDALREAAIEAGSRTKFSATEAANAVEELAKAGVSAADILGGGLNGALDLAAAGNLDVAKAAEIASTSMNQFGLAGSDVPHIADVISAAAGKASGEVADMGLAFSYVGPVASQMGVSIEETAGAIAFLSQSGVGGEKAGNALRGMLTSLTSPSKIAADTMAELGINMYDAQGEFIGLDGMAGALKTSLGGLGEAERNAALGRIFGNEQITAARVLYEGGADAITKWTAAVDDQGYAAETAAIKMDNLKGDLEQLGGSLETALIGTGTGADGPLRDLVQTLGGLVDAYNELPAPIKSVVLASAGLTAGIGGTVFVASRAIEGFANLNKSLDGVGLKFEGANKKALLFQRGGALALAGGLAAASGPIKSVSQDLGTLADIASATALGFAVGGPWGAAIGGGISLLTALGDSGNEASVNLDGLTSTLDQQTGAVTDNTAAWAATELQNSGLADILDELGISLTTATDAVLGNKDAMNELESAAGQLGSVKGTVLDPINKMADAVESEGEKLANTTEATNGLRDGVIRVGAASDETAGKVESLKKELDGLLNPLLDQDQATVAWRLSLMSLNEDLSKQGRSLDLNTKSGLDNRNAIRDRVEALQASAAADSEAGVAADKVGDKLKRGRTSIIDAGVAAGFSEREMRKYLKQLGLTPESVDTLIKAQDFATPRVKAVKAGLGILDGITASPRIALAGAGAAQSAINSATVGLNLLDGKVARTTIITETKTRKAAGGSTQGFDVRFADNIPNLLKETA